MKMKKANAVITLISMFLFLLHMIYNVLAFMMGFYNPVLSKIFGFSLLFLIALHAVMSIVIVAVFHDSKTIQYKKKNMRTRFQRITAGIMVLLLPLHIFEIPLLQKTRGIFLFSLLQSVKFIFYSAVLFHVALSLTNAFVTLGWMEDRRKKNRIDRALLITAVILVVVLGVFFTVKFTGFLSD